MKNTQIARIAQEGMRDGTHIDIEVSYLIGGSRNTPRGYYLYAKPVTVSEWFLTTIPTSNKRCLLFEASRFSEKSMAKAVELGKSQMQKMIDILLAEQLCAEV